MFPLDRCIHRILGCGTDLVVGSVWVSVGAMGVVAFMNLQLDGLHVCMDVRRTAEMEGQK